MDKKKEKERIESSATFDDRRKQLIHTSIEEKETDRGTLRISAVETIHEQGIRNTLASLEKQKELIKGDIAGLEELTGNPPEMTPDLEVLKEQIKKLQIIRHHEITSEEQKKKESDQLSQKREELTQVEKHIKEIRDAIGSRLKI